MRKVVFKNMEVELLTIEELKQELSKEQITKMIKIETNHNLHHNDKICRWTKIKDEYVQVYESEVIEND